MRNPYFKFYPSDWRGDPDLKACSLAARGLWIEMIALMHAAEPYGHLIAGKVRYGLKDAAKLAMQVGVEAADCKRALTELHDAEVFSIADDGTIYSRRMVAFAKRSETNRLNGLGGGNPVLLSDNQKRAESLNQKTDSVNQKSREDSPLSGFATSGSGVYPSEIVLELGDASAHATEHRAPAWQLAIDVMQLGIDAGVVEKHLALDVPSNALRDLKAAESLLAAYGRVLVLTRAAEYATAYLDGRIKRRLSCKNIADTWGWDNVWQTAPKAAEAPLSAAGQNALAALDAAERRAKAAAAV